MNTDTLQQARIDLAAALRLAVRFGFNEGICNHFSYMVPGTQDHFLINPQGFHWSEITAGSLVLMDSEGNVIEGDAPAEPTAFFIHSRIHLGLPHARCVLHTHMPYATALTALENGRLEPISQTALGFYERVAYDDDYNGLALDAEEGDRITRALDNKYVLFLANHGVVVIGPDLGQAFNDLYYLERACQLQVLAMSTGQPLRRVSAQMATKTARQFVSPENQAQVAAHFTALKRLLDRDEPDYQH